MIFVYVVITVIIIASVLVFIQARNKKNELNNSLNSFCDINNFNCNKKYINIQDGFLLTYDEVKKKIILIKRNKEPKTIDFNLVLDCVVSIDGETINKSSVTNIIGGAILGGGIGALIGASIKSKKVEKIDNISLVLTINDLSSPKLEIKFPILGMTSDYDKEEVEEWHNVFKVIIERNKPVLQS